MGQNVSGPVATANSDQGSKRPGRQTRSKAELDQRIRYVVRLLRRCRTKGEIKRFIKCRYGCSARTTERYLSLARRRSRKVPRHEEATESRQRRDALAEIFAGLPRRDM